MARRYIFNETRTVHGETSADILENMRKSEADLPEGETLASYAARLMQRVSIQDATFVPVDAADSDATINALIAAGVLLAF